MNRSLRIAIAVFIAVGVAAGYAVDYVWIAPTPGFSPPRLVSVRKGESLRVVARRLADRGVITSATVMMAYAELAGEASRIQPGDYAFKGGERIPDVLRHLVNGDFMVVTVTIPEGLTVHQIAARLQEAGLVCDSQFESAARRGWIVKAIGLGSFGAEGYLFPATYRFSPFAKTDAILTAMLSRFYEILTPSVEERMFQLGMDPRSLVTMASIVEKEAKVASERPLIAGVFYNRLRLGMPLQSDPTAEYSFGGDVQGPVSIAVRTPSTFNTYAIKGLPPAPIANPGLSSIMAALYPANTDCLYFVARNDGTHVFSRSLKEHERAIAAIKRSAASIRAAQAESRSARGTE